MDGSIFETFDTLPDELVLDVFRRFDKTEDIESLGRTSRRTRSIGKDAATMNLWYRLKCRETSGNPEEFDRYTRGQHRDYKDDYERGVFEDAFNEAYFDAIRQIEQRDSATTYCWVNTNGRVKLFPREIGLLSRSNVKSFGVSSASSTAVWEFPEELGTLASVTSMRLSLARDGRLPDSLALVPLEQLRIDQNILDEMPEVVTRMTSLQKLEVSVRKLPVGLKNLTNLIVLKISGIVERIPEGILGRLRSLASLELSRGKLEELPVDITSLARLEYLNVSFNRLSRLPDNMGDLTNLKELNLEENPLKKVPESFWKLRNLEILHLERTDFGRLPSLLTRLESLQWICIDEQLSRDPVALELKRNGVQVVSWRANFGYV